MNGTETHPDFFDIGVYVSEYKMLSDNRLIDQVRSKVPDYRETDLLRNNYKMYYKNFALWSINCQDEYSTEDIAYTGHHFSQVSDFINKVLYISIAFLVFDLIYGFLLVADVFDKCMHKKFSMIIFVILRTGLFVGVFLCYINALKAM